MICKLLSPIYIQLILDCSSLPLFHQLLSEKYIKLNLALQTTVILKTYWLTFYQETNFLDFAEDKINMTEKLLFV